ncbi:MAG: hypothetical protein ARM1_0363 [Candidatus Micrarchaeota archaeon]|nr:MAG: hypothetical protein ARM1_0363 [Candidatus Micrarchaeota archaeon]
MAISIIALMLDIASYLGINIDGIIVSAGFAGIVLGLAAQTVLGNVFAGILINVLRPFRIGDEVTFLTWQYGLIAPSYYHGPMVPGYRGKIVRMGLNYSEIRLDNGDNILVPNGVLIQAGIIEHNRDRVKSTIRVEVDKRISFKKLSELVNSKIAKNTSIMIDIKKGLISIGMSITDIQANIYGVELSIVADRKHISQMKNEISDIIREAIVELSKSSS